MQISFRHGPENLRRGEVAALKQGTSDVIQEVVQHSSVSNDALATERAYQELWYSIERLAVIEREAETESVRVRCHAVRAQILYALIDETKDDVIMRMTST